MRNACGIYLLRNKVNGKVYIGQSVHTWRRWHEHKKSAKRGDKSHLYDAFRKYGAEAFEYVLLEECDPLQFDARETYWVAFYDARNPEKGYNYMPAGQRGRIMDAEMREKMSASMRGRKLAPEVVEKIRQANTGRKHSEEARRKISQANRGRINNPDAIARTAAKLRARWEAMSPEDKAAYAAARTGHKWPEEARQRMSAQRKGKKKSEETRAKMCEASRRRWAAYRAAKEAVCPSV